MPQFIKQITNFNQGMSPLYKKGSGISRLEHFDTTTEEAFPFKKLVASTMNNTTSAITNFTRGVDSAGNTNQLWALGKIFDDPNYNPVLLYWNSSKEWSALKNFGTTYTIGNVLHFCNGNVYGLLKSGSDGYIWKIIPGATGGTTTFTYNHKALNYTTYCTPVTHSKDGRMYFGTDNVISILTADGATLTTGVTLPTNFVITSISENGDYLMIVGYDKQTYKSTAYMWDRDSSLATLTQKYDLFYDRPVLTFNVSGTQFCVSTNHVTTNPISASPTNNLMIKYLNGDKFSILSNYLFTSLALDLTASKVYVENDRAYFPAVVELLDDTAKHFVVFCLDGKGKLTIAQNMAITDAGDVNVVPTDVLKENVSFWIAGGTNGQWNTSSAYPSVSAQSAFIETEWYSAKDITKAIKVVGVTVDFEPLPSGSSVTLKTRSNEETAWTTIGTFDTDNAMRGSAISNSISNARYRQFRVESLGGAQIISFQVTFEEISDQSYG